MLDQLKKLCEEKIFIQLHTNASDMKSFLYGRILSINEEAFMFYMISTKGEYDGILVGKTDDIQYFAIGGAYDEKMQSLTLKDLNIDIPFLMDSDTLYSYALKKAKKSRKIVAVSICNSIFDDVTGFVEDVTNSICKFQNIDEYGKKDGYSYVPLKNITQISYDSENEQILLRLFLLNDNKIS